MNLVKREELWLEGGGVRFVYKDEYVEALEKQRDELLAALEWAADVLPPSDPYGMGVCDCPVCRAIESVKGGAA